VRLEHVLSFQEQRQVRYDWTISWRNRCFQLTATNQKLALAGQRILVCEHLDGSLHLWFRKRELTWLELPERPRRPKAAPIHPSAAGTTAPHAAHPCDISNVMGQGHILTFDK